jgi:hypothetical protein
MMTLVTKWSALLLAVHALALADGCASSQRPAEAAAATPPPEDARAYYPLTAGWKWAYELEKGGDRILATYAVKEAAGDTVILEAGEERLSYALRPDGVARKEGLTIGDFILKSPIKQGTTWAVAGGKATVTAVGRTVTVAAGTFPNCATIEEARTDPERVIRTTYAAGVGPVIVEYQVHDASAGRFEMAVRATLRGMTRPGEDPLQ